MAADEFNQTPVSIKALQSRHNTRLPTAFHFGWCLSHPTLIHSQRAAHGQKDTRRKTREEDGGG